MTFNNILEKYRNISFSERNKGERFEHLIQSYLLTDPKYAYQLTSVWIWQDFPYKDEFGGKDIGIDLVAITYYGEYWAIQCKFYDETGSIDKPSVDSFLSTSAKSFKDEKGNIINFSNRLWVSTTNNWSSNAEEAIRNQTPSVQRLSLSDLENAQVNWQNIEQGISGEKARLEKKVLFKHQVEALNSSHEYFKTSDRGKLIMACGTGKTFTSLKIAETQTQGKGLILFLVPSIALLGQSLNEWTAQASESINAICICSDSGVSKKAKMDNDTGLFSVVDLALPASTDTKSILKQIHNIRTSKKTGLTVIFSTYQSIDVISRAQLELLKIDPSYGIFDLIICDEAHRTTGVTLASSEESNFVKVHDNSFIQARKRLYMTATPRLFSDDSKSKAAQAEAVLCSMDDSKIYGEEIYRIGFGKAVEQDLLSDYKVLILTVSDNDIPPAIQKMIASKESELNTDDASKLIGCINALSKKILGDDGILREIDPLPMRRAVAFCSSIKDSRIITNVFNETHKTYINSLPEDKQEGMVHINSDHVDGTMSAPLRDKKLTWLKSQSEETNECKVLSNARCLSEGVDVPSLDAVLFLSARNSQVDIVQSVGRVMRKSPGKKYGYIIIPVVIPSNIEADKGLENNERYKVVWSVLNALRAHDDRFNATINKIDLNKKKPGQIIVGKADNGFGTIDSVGTESSTIAHQLTMQFEQLQSIVFARMVEKVGDRRYWEQWAKDVAQIAERNIQRINNIVKEGKHKIAFANFLKGLQKNINPSISETEAIEMLAQHIITKPVFEALFEGYSFVKNNPISVSMQSMLDILEEQALEKDAETLEKFYQSVRKRAEGIDNAEGKQRIIIELYDKFFKAAFPKMVEKLGIVYTPVECVDFIIHSVNDILIKEFGRTISDENIHILDPFTGTGTFITRLLQSGLIKTEDLERKYKHEIHANEIVLLAYYIAAVNIENAYHDQTPDIDDGITTAKYTPFEGICLTDTFQLGETDASERLFSEMFPQNSERVQNQKKAPLRVIMGNPPYSVGQKSANDNAQNQEYPKLNKRIEITYASQTTGLKNSLYDSYIKAFRWSSDRLDKSGGIICFISNGAWIDGNSTSGFRKCLEKEFTSIYVFNLRGNQRTSGELSRKEGGKIFGSGSRTPISITLLVKNPDKKNELALSGVEGKATIHYHDIGDYLDREEKLSIITKFKTISNPQMPWQTLHPNEHGDWINHRKSGYNDFFLLGGKKTLNDDSVFSIHSSGVMTNRDAWVTNFSNLKLELVLNKMISYFNTQAVSFKLEKQVNTNLHIDDFIDRNPINIKWDSNLIRDVAKGDKRFLQKEEIVDTIYRPFVKSKYYFNKDFNWSRLLQPKLFPVKGIKNKVIAITGPGSNNTLTVLIIEYVANRDMIEKCLCFPLYYYEEKKKGNTLFDNNNNQSEEEYERKEAISDFILKQAHTTYKASNINKEDIFYYVYGFLHSPEYRVMFANDLKKMLPRIPLVESVNDFWSFSKSGRKLADLHLNYETVSPAEGVIVNGAEKGNFEVEKMRFPKKDQKDTIIYNSHITISNIPAEAYQYVVNGKSAIEWIMERYQVSIHKESGIKNDPNDWATEVGNPRYILDLLLSIIRVSTETMEIVKTLPVLKFE